ncbi:MAG: hypothetical protein WAM92_13965 [Mycobacterium sp.]
MPQDGAWPLDVSGHDPSEMVALTDGVAFEVAGDDGCGADLQVPLVSLFRFHVGTPARLRLAE